MSRASLARKVLDIYPNRVVIYVLVVGGQRVSVVCYRKRLDPGPVCMAEAGAVYRDYVIERYEADPADGFVRVEAPDGWTFTAPVSA